MSSVDAPSKVATSIGDNVATLNKESNNMGAVKVATPIREGHLQPTSKMSIEDLLKMETQCADFSVSPDAEIGTVIYQSVVNPISITSNVTTRVEWLTRMFRYWCGMLTFKFIFTKTILQQTKFLAVFVPNAKESDDPPSTADAYYYAHKMVMNPANETEVSMTIPFVSDRPYLPMSESTGMFYFMVYQPIVASFDTATSPADIYVKVFVSGEMTLHETVPLINLSSESASTTAPELLWTIAKYNLTPMGAFTSLGSVGMKTDTGSVVPCSTWDVAAYNHPAFDAGKPIGGQDTNTTTTYLATSCRTLAGKPSGTGYSRAAYIVTDDIAVDAALKVVKVAVCSNATGVWLTLPVAGTNNGVEMFDQIIDLAGTYVELFETLPTFSAEFDKLITVLGSAGFTIDDLLVAKSQRMLTANGNDCDLECDCGACCSHDVVDAEKKQPDMSNYEDRLATFSKWPITHIKPTDLASNGFYYYGVRDCVRCFSCRVVLERWVYGDDVIQEHDKFSPDCEMLCMCCSNFKCVDHRSKFMSPCREFSAYHALFRHVCTTCPRIHAERDFATVVRKEGWTNPALANVMMSSDTLSLLPNLTCLITDLSNICDVDIAIHPDLTSDGKKATYKLAIHNRKDISTGYKLDSCSLLPSIRNFDFVQKFPEFDFYERIFNTARFQLQPRLRQALGSQFDTSSPRCHRIWKLLNC